MLNQDICFYNDLEKLLNENGADKDTAIIIYCNCGKLQIEMDDQSYQIIPNDLLLCQPNLIIGKYLRTPDLDCTAISIRKHALDDVLTLCVREDNKWWEKAQYLRQNPVIHLNPHQQELLKQFEKLFLLATDETEHELSDNIRRIFVQAAVCELLIWLEGSVQLSDSEPRRLGRQDVIFREFITLIRKEKGRRREVQWFADKLAISPKYLTAVCHAVGGKSASTFIHEGAMIEIKRLMRQSDLSIKEISAQMNFPSLSFFCKYVKHNLGVSARAYRRGEGR